MKYLAAVVALGAALLCASALRGAAPAPLQHTEDSSEALAAAVLDGFARRDVTTLRSLALSEQEFRQHVWPLLPASRPERNLTADYVWSDLKAKSDAYLRTNLNRVLPPAARVVRVTYLGATNYGAFTVHRESGIVVADPSGREHVLRLFGSAIEKNGRFKVFSFVTD